MSYREVEEAYFKDTGIYPIMHTVAISVIFTRNTHGLPVI